MINSDDILLSVHISSLFSCGTVSRTVGSYKIQYVPYVGEGKIPQKKLQVSRFFYCQDKLWLV